MSRAVTAAISSRNRMSDPGLVTCDPGQDFVVVIVNDDERDHTVWIDPADVVYRPRKAANPLSLKRHKVKIRAGSIGVIRQRIKSKSHFFKKRAGDLSGTKVPYGRYKYTIRWSGGGSKALDPDLEVSPPY